MPPGISKANMEAKGRRKQSERSEEQQEEGDEEQPQLNIISRQRRSAAMKTHRVWDTLKPGAKPHLDTEEEHSGPESSSAPAAKKPRPSPKKKINQKNDEHDEQQKPAEAVGLQNAQQGEQKVTVYQKSQQQPPMAEHQIVVAKKATTVKVFHQQQQPAMSKEQLEMIEREMEKHNQFDEEGQDEPSDEEDEDDGQQPDTRTTSRYVLDDEEFMMGYEAKGRGRGRGRGRGGGGRGGTASGPTAQRGGATRGRPRGSRAGIPAASMGGGVMRGRINNIGSLRPPNVFSPQPRLNGSGPAGVYSLQQPAVGACAGGIVGDLANRQSAGAQSQFGLRVLRPAGVPVQQLGGGIQTLRSSSIAPVQMNVNESNFTINRELENYRNRIVAGSSVQEFNDIISHLLDEYQRVVDDRSRLVANNRDFVNHLKLTHQAAQDIKDNKIRHLEQTIEQLQHKLMQSLKQEQLHVVRQHTLPSAGGLNEGQGENKIGEGGSQLKQEDQQESAGVNQPLITSAGPTGTSASGYRWGGANAKVMGMDPSGSGQIPQLPLDHPYFDDELDDEEEEFDDEEDSAQMDDELGAQVTI